MMHYHWRKSHAAKHNIALDIPLDKAPPEQLSSETWLKDLLNREAVDWILNLCDTPEDREVLQLYYLSRMTDLEIGVKLDITRHAAVARRNRARMRVRSKVDIACLNTLRRRLET